jgi:hypothetical protein
VKWNYKVEQKAIKKRGKEVVSVTTMTMTTTKTTKPCRGMDLVAIPVPITLR